MTPPRLYPSRSLARLYAAQGRQKEAEIILARLGPGGVQQPIPSQTAINPAEAAKAPETTGKPNQPSFQQIVVRMGQWVDLVGRCRFCDKSQPPENL